MALESRKKVLGRIFSKIKEEKQPLEKVTAVTGQIMDECRKRYDYKFFEPYKNKEEFVDSLILNLELPTLMLGLTFAISILAAIAELIIAVVVIAIPFIFVAGGFALIFSTHDKNGASLPALPYRCLISVLVVPIIGALALAATAVIDAIILTAAALLLAGSGIILAGSLVGSVVSSISRPIFTGIDTAANNLPSFTS